MANFLINSAGLMTTGTDDAETFLVQSAAVSGTSLVGANGADTIELLEGTSSADAVSIAGEGGKDVFKVSGTVFDTASVLKGNAGGDIFTFSGSVNMGGTVGGGAGNDTILFQAATEIGTLEAGAGADNLTATAAVSGSAAAIKLGAGADTIDFQADFQLNSAAIQAGGGNDKITLSSDTESSTALSVKLGAGADTLTLDLTGAKLEILGGGGNDIIKQSAGQYMESAIILGGAGNDSLSFVDLSGAADGNYTIGGGAGADTIIFEASALETTDASILGGGGNDSINIDATYSGTATTAGTVIGGAGADSITFSGGLAEGGDSALATRIGYADWSDSTESTMDVLGVADFSGTSDSGAAVIIQNMGLGDNFSEATGLAVNGMSAAASIAVFSSVSSLTDRVAKLDTTLTTTGQVAVFSDVSASAAYLFVQGGDTDLVVKLNGSESISAISAVNVANSSITIQLAPGA